MKILIVSDTHGQNYNFFEAVKREEPVDMIIHCGDVEGAEDTIARSIQGPVVVVPGNNDFFSKLPRERIFPLGPYKAFVTHGHHYYVSMGTEIIKEEAKARGVDIVFFGHTHRPVVDQSGGVIAVNPGSLSYPRQEGRKPSYIVMEMGESGSLDFEIKYL